MAGQGAQEAGVGVCVGSFKQGKSGEASVEGDF